MATLLRIARRLEALIRENPGNALDLLRAIRREIFGSARNPVQVQVQEVVAGNDLVAANRRNVRHWMRWLGALGGGLLGLGSLLWFIRRGRGEVGEIGNAIDLENGGGRGGDAGNADGGGHGGIDPGFLLFQMASYLGWNGGDNSNGAGNTDNGTGTGQSSNGAGGDISNTGA